MTAQPSISERALHQALRMRLKASVAYEANDLSERDRLVKLAQKLERFASRPRLVWSRRAA